MAEEFALEQCFRNGAAIDRLKAFVSPGTLPVDGFCDEVLADAALSCDENAHRGWRYLPNHLPDLPRAFRPSENLSQRLRLAIDEIEKFAQILGAKRKVQHGIRKKFVRIRGERVCVHDQDEGFAL